MNGNFQPNFYANEFTASFAGFQDVDVLSSTAGGYSQYSFAATATGASSVLQFSGSSVGFTQFGILPLYLDDISVTDAGPAAVPEASSVVSLGLLLSLGLSGLAVSAKRRRASSAV